MRRWKKVILAVLASVALIIAGLVINAVLFIRPKYYDRLALSNGLHAKMAQEVYYQNTGGENGGHYTTSWKALFPEDLRTGLEDPGVTFIFGECNSSGYTFTTSHAMGNKGPKGKFVFTN